MLWTASAPGVKRREAAIEAMLLRMEFSVDSKVSGKGVMRHATGASCHLQFGELVAVQKHSWEMG